MPVIQTTLTPDFDHRLRMLCARLGLRRSVAVRWGLLTLLAAEDRLGEGTLVSAFATDHEPLSRTISTPVTSELATRIAEAAETDGVSVAEWLRRAANLKLTTDGGR